MEFSIKKHSLKWCGINGYHWSVTIKNGERVHWFSTKDNAEMWLIEMMLEE